MSTNNEAADTSVEAFAEQQKERLWNILSRQQAVSGGTFPANELYAEFSARLDDMVAQHEAVKVSMATDVTEAVEKLEAAEKAALQGWREAR